MAEVNKSGTPSISSIGLQPGAQKLPALICGEDITAGDACRIHSDGKVMRSSGAAANASAKVHGFAPTTEKQGTPISLVCNVTMRYGAALTPGASLFLSGSALGGLADAASTGGTAPIGVVVDATRVYLYQSRY